MINKNSDIFFGDKEVPIVSGEDLKDFTPNSHRIAVYEIDGKDHYTLLGKEGFGFFAVKRVGDER